MSYVEQLKKVVTINSFTNNKKGVDEVGEYFATLLKTLGMQEKIFKRELLGNHRLFSSKHESRSDKILLLGHLDTVFPPETFTEFKEDEKWVYGPGVCDMKGGNIVAFKALEALKKEGVEIKNIDFLLVSDEETGSDDSKYLSEKLSKDYSYCFVFEAAGAQMEIVVGRKGVGTFRIDIKGVAKHAGNHYDEGVDANLEAALKLQKLVSLTDLSKNSTVNVGEISGGVGANTISAYAHLLFEIRYDRKEEKERILREIQTVVETSYVKGTQASISGGIQRDVMQPSDELSSFVKVLEKITDTPLKTQKRGGVSDANIFSSCGVLTLDGFGPYGDGDHTVHERALKSSFISRIELMRKILKYFIKHNGFRYD